MEPEVVYKILNILSLVALSIPVFIVLYGGNIVWRIHQRVKASARNEIEFYERIKKMNRKNKGRKT